MLLQVLLYPTTSMTCPLLHYPKQTNSLTHSFTHSLAMMMMIFDSVVFLVGWEHLQITRNHRIKHKKQTRVGQHNTEETKTNTHIICIKLITILNSVSIETHLTHNHNESIPNRVLASSNRSYCNGVIWAGRGAEGHEEQGVTCIESSPLVLVFLFTKL
jgi:hypothetical protein